VLFGSFALAVSMENNTEQDVFSPSARGEPVEYYYAWQQVFTLNLQNREDPSLSEFYDGGFVHHFSREVGAMALGPEEIEATYDAEIEDMLEAAGIHLTWSRIESALYGLIGGRLHDTEAEVGLIVASRRLDVDQTIYLNRFANRRGVQAFVDEYNDGQLAEVLITDPVGRAAPVPSTGDLVAVILPLAVALMVTGLAFSHTRTLSAVGLTVVVTFALGMGWIRADNFRFLMPSSAFGLVVAIGVLAQLVRDRSALVREYGGSGRVVRSSDTQDGPHGLAQPSD
jgi:hypothetical protein